MSTALSIAKWIAYCLLSIIALLLPVILFQGPPGETASLVCWIAGMAIGTSWWRRSRTGRPS